MSLLLKLKSPQAEQLDQVVEIDQQCLGGIWSLEGYQRELASPNTKLTILSIVGDEEGRRQEVEERRLLSEQIIGIGCFWSILEEAHITLLAIHPDYQGQGLGKLMLNALLKKAFDCKLERATLEVRASNQVALSLYEKFGFKIAGRRKRYYQKTGEDALILWRGDLPHPEFTRDLEIWQQEVSDRLLKNGWKLLSE